LQRQQKQTARKIDVK